MGFNHARVYAEMDNVELVGVADPEPSVRARITRRLRVPTFESYAHMFAETAPNAVSVVVPTTLHHAVAADVIDAGCHVLVEKPIASTEDEGADLIVRAADRGVAFSVGHVERFNPAVRELKARLNAGELGQIYQVHARRLGPFPARVRDVGVVIDLATHDVDVMRFLLDSDVIRVYGEIARRLHTEHEDLLSGLLRFRNGAIGVLDVNWLTPTKIREVTVTGERGMFVVNYLTQDLTFFKNDWAHQTWHAGDERQTVSEGDIVKIRVDRQEALAAELAAFVRAALGESPLEVTGYDGLEALRIASALVRSGIEHRHVVLSDDEVIASV
ncbi:MAG: Gfo/Idh/MocA family oxidoreductase [Chloroflexota bacterium]|nr:MAG: Gfo/Idh/MocA family oxidoreductase [Chloroflexota bacterium]